MASKEKIKLMRSLAGRISQEKIGKHLGLERSTYARREAAGDFTSAELSKMAEFLKCKVDDFLEDKPKLENMRKQSTTNAMVQSMRETIDALKEQVKTQREYINFLKSLLSPNEMGDEDLRD